MGDLVHFHFLELVKLVQFWKVANCDVVRLTVASHGTDNQSLEKIGKLFFCVLVFFFDCGWRRRKCVTYFYSFIDLKFEDVHEESHFDLAPWLWRERQIVDLIDFRLVINGNVDLRNPHEESSLLKRFYRLQPVLRGTTSNCQLRELFVTEKLSGAFRQIVIWAKIEAPIESAVT